MIASPLERLDGRFVVLRHRHDDIAVVRRLLLADDDVISVMDAGLDHALTDDG